MTDSLAPAQPADESGADTFRRYRYQAHIAVPFCLDCALGGEVLAVVPEYFEDLALQVDGGWRLLQIKTRDERRGAWRLAHILGSKGGVGALHRSYARLRDADRLEGCVLELLLEGSLQPGDKIERLRNHDAVGADQELIGAFREKLSLDEAECQDFLTRFRLRPDQPPRVYVEDRNFRVFRDQAEHLDGTTLRDVYGRLIARIEEKMGDAPLPGDDWPVNLFSGSEQQDPLAAKRLTRIELQTLLDSLIASPRPLLRRVLEAEADRPSAMDEKLLAAGSSPELIEQARQLRANAQTVVTAALAAGSDRRAEEIDDLHTRLRTRFVSLPTEHAQAASPAATIWGDLITRLGAQATDIDPRRILHADPDLLMGEICELTDQCELRWVPDNES